jgi:hypothetical protein
LRPRPIPLGPARRQTRALLLVRQGPSSSLHVSAISAIGSVSAEIDELAPRKGTSGLLQPTTREKAAEVDGLKSEALNQPLDEPLRFGVFSRDENHATAAVLRRSFTETSGHDRVESFDDASARRQASHYLAGSLAAQVGQHEIRAVSWATMSALASV